MLDFIRQTLKSPLNITNPIHVCLSSLLCLIALTDVRAVNRQKMVASQHRVLSTHERVVQLFSRISEEKYCQVKVNDISSCLIHKIYNVLGTLVARIEKVKNMT